jgi:hypothetical protein
VKKSKTVRSMESNSGGAYRSRAQVKPEAHERAPKCIHLITVSY